MKSLLSLLLCFLMLSVSTVNGETPNQLPTAVSSILDKRFPGWRFSEVSGDVQQFFAARLAAPNLIKGDFDGNGQIDYAVLIEHSNFDKSGVGFSHVVETLAFLKTGAAYKLYTLGGNAPANLELYLTLARKGEEGRNFHTEKKFRYPNDSIHVSYFEKAGGTYIYSKGRFRHVVESD